MAELSEWIDGANVDLKGFSEKFYRDITGGQLKPVLESIKYLYSRNVVVEVTNLIVPTINDDLNEISEMCKWLAGEVSPDVPIHFSRFFPNYKLKHLPPTAISKLTDAREIAKKAGLKHVYIGNVSDKEGQDTICSKCGRVLVERLGYKIISNNLKSNSCDKCGEKIYGLWEVE